MAAPAPTTIPPPPVPPANQPGVLSRLLNAVGSVYTNPSYAPLLGLASGFGAAGAPHMLTPISMGQAVNMANQSAQAYRQQVVGANIQQEAALPFQVMRTQALEKSFRDAMNPALPAHQRAAAAYRVDSLMGWNAASDPTVANRLAQIKAQYQPVSQAPGATLTTASNVAQGAGQVAHGAVPEASLYNPQTNTVQQAAGAPAVLAANAANKAGGAAAATLPYALAQHYVTRAPGTAGGTLGPQPGPFAPVQPGAPNPAAMQRMIGLQEGLTSTAQAAGRPAPMAPAPGIGPSGGWPQRTPAGVAPPGSLAAERAAGERNLPAVVAQVRAANAAGLPATGGARPALTLPAAQGTAPAAPNGIFSRGMTPAQVAMSTGQGKQAVDMNAGYQKQAEDAKDMLAQLQSLDQAAHNFAPGQFADARIKGLQWLQSVGLITPAEMNRLGSAQEGAKMTIQLQSAFTKSLGSREAAQIFATLGRGVPNLTMSPDGFAKVSAYMAGMARYNMLRAEHAQTYFNAGNIKGVNSVRDQFIAHTNPAYFIIASAPPAVQRAMIAAMGSKARPFLQRWQKAINSGWAPEPDAYGAVP